MDKYLVSFRLSSEGRRALDDAARHLGVTRTAVVEMAVRAFRAGQDGSTGSTGGVQHHPALPGAECSDDGPVGPQDPGGL